MTGTTRAAARGMTARRGRALGIAFTILLVVGCGQDEIDEAPRTSGGAVAVAEVGEAVISPEVLRAQGESETQEALKAAMTFASVATFNEDLLVDPTAEDFEFLTEYLVPATADEMRVAVDGALEGREEDELTVRRFANFSVLDSSTKRHEDGSDLVVEHRIEDVRVDPGSNGSKVDVSFTQSGDLRVLRDGEPVRVRMTREVTYGLDRAPASGALWLIREVRAEWDEGVPVVEAGS